LGVSQQTVKLCFGIGIEGLAEATRDGKLRQSSAMIHSISRSTSIVGGSGGKKSSPDGLE
jgi:hypothetical protein